MAKIVLHGGDMGGEKIESDVPEGQMARVISASGGTYGFTLLYRVDPGATGTYCGVDDTVPRAALTPSS